MGQSYTYPLTFPSSGQTFVNRNSSQSFNLSATSNLTQLADFVCSEVFISNKSGQIVYLFDSGNFSLSSGFRLDDKDTITLYGITNSAQVSAQTATGSGNIYYRPKMYSFTMSN